MEIIELLQKSGHSDSSTYYYGAGVLDITACVACRSLFFCLTNLYKQSVWKIQFPNKSTSKINESEKKYIYSPARPSVNPAFVENDIMRLSTNSLDELLVLMLQSGRWCVYIYRSSDGNQLQKIIIQDTNIQPKHAVKTSNIFITVITKANAMFVGEMSLDGEMIRKFDFDLLESFQNAKLSTPYESYLAFDGNKGIFVADSSNNKIFLVNTQLKEGQIIKLPDSPTELFQRSLTSILFYLFDKHYLIVGQFIKIPEPPSRDHRDIDLGDRTWTSVSIFDLRSRMVDQKSRH